jgi:hypothetical protein
METSQKTNEEAPLNDKFNAEDHGTKWHLFCKVCGRGWALNKKKDGEDYHPGNLLHLLNHARSHEPTE